MLTTMDLKSYASTQRAKLVGNIVMGSFQDYPYSITVQQGKKKSCAVLLIPVWGKIPNKALQQMRQSLKDTKAVLSFVAGKTPKLQAVLTAPNESLLQNMTSLRYRVVQLLSDMSVSAPPVCPVCGTGNCDCLAYLDGYRKAHSICIENSLYKAKAGVKKRQDRGSYGSGFIGALLGALVGLIPTILLALFLNLISAWLFALIPIAAFLGYKVLGGKMDGKMPLVVVIIASLLILPVLELAQFYASVVQQWDEYLSLGEAVMAYLYYMTPADTAINMLQPLLFMGLGLFISWRTISQNNDTTLLKAEALQASVAPLENASRFEQPQFERWVEKVEFDDHLCYDQSKSTADISHDDLLRQYDNVDDVSRETFKE